ncbi:cyclodeaminase/cyclohydrolase family protein [Thermomicrobium sp. 4228-Ro]|uniref:cyclodeaminase/cyclohydrolase family protein n=1 Tax=Thermomicrobium sp. 4228-Ro TaxID=2993937 RepID=UPI002249847A|nr:cyclodeaminase/cyclohydrolase family protein [Thermomicrobium sp. 4228-Ro]MCX2726168.1 cyclodeaminase/cyclohydrolase family protein [Thermomicrobium sp. 4228-Ro]
MTSTSETIAEWPVRELVDRMRRPRYRCGGGVAACIALAQAAALADLVRRASQRVMDRALSEQLAAAFAETLQQALAQADRDRLALHQLLEALRHDSVTEQLAFVERATTVPLATADLGIELLGRLAHLEPHVPAFAASDLEAAKALARAAIQAALAMARANIPLLPAERAGQLADEITARLSKLNTALP